MVSNTMKKVNRNLELFGVTRSAGFNIISIGKKYDVSKCKEADVCRREFVCNCISMIANTA